MKPIYVNNVIKCNRIKISVTVPKRKGCKADVDTDFEKVVVGLISIHHQDPIII